MVTALILFFVALPLLLAFVGYMVTRSSPWGGLGLVVLTGVFGLAMTLFWFAFVAGCVLGLIFPKQPRRSWP